MTPEALFTADQSLRSVVAAAAGPCECRNPQSGCSGCFPFCHSSTSKAVALCLQSRANNPMCKLPGFVCPGCDAIPHSDHAEYYVCKL